MYKRQVFVFVYVFVFQSFVLLFSLSFPQGVRHSWKLLQTRSPSVHAWLHSEANTPLMLRELAGDYALIVLYASVFVT